VAVIAKSFARIHESNLKKQGLLALTFSDPKGYDCIREDDRISLVKLDELAPEKPVECIVHHADGTSDVLSLTHSYSASQIEWFKRGSALNLFQQGASSEAPPPDKVTE
jgi:aconitate hydratase